jgi:hypothetical protein
MVRGSLGMVLVYHCWIWKDPKPYWSYMEHIEMILGQIGLFLEYPEYSRRSNPGGWITIGLGLHEAHPWPSALGR